MTSPDSTADSDLLLYSNGYKPPTARGSQFSFFTLTRCTLQAFVESQLDELW